MDNQWRNQVIALAGITQAIATMDELAKTGYLRTAQFEVTTASLFEQNPPDTESVFGSLSALETGLDVIINSLSNRKNKDSTTMIGYCLGILHLQKRLSKNRAMLSAISDRLDKARHQVHHFGLTHDNVVANLAEIYSATISTFPFRIQVIGEYQHLQQQRVANQVRVLLLGAVRAATLWRQLGGRRYKLLLYKKQILETAEMLQREIRSQA